MNHKEFCIKWIGKYYVEPWMSTVECVGLSKLYCQERGYPINWFWWSAIKGWKTGSPFNSKWERIVYKPWMYPPQWAILFFSEKRCKYWHTWVANKFCNPNLLRYIDQNGTGRRDKITPRFTDYKHLLGWYKLK